VADAGTIKLAKWGFEVALNCDHPSVDSWYVGNAPRWAQLVGATARRVPAAGATVVTVAPFNEPDYGWGSTPARPPMASQTSSTSAASGAAFRASATSVFRAAIP
jgi:hypothetical protein